MNIVHNFMGTSERRAREKNQRKQEILRTARKIFWTKSFEETTMLEIAKAAELSPGTLYLYFPSKETLYAALLNEGYELLLALLRNGLQENDSPLQQAENLIDIFFQFARENPEYFDIIFFVLQRDKRTVKDVLRGKDHFDRLGDKQNECKELVARVLKRGRFNTLSGNPSHMVDAIWSMLAGIVFYFKKEDSETFKSVTDSAKHVILSGLFGKAVGKEIETP